MVSSPGGRREYVGWRAEERSVGLDPVFRHHALGFVHVELAGADQIRMPNFPA